MQASSWSPPASWWCCRCCSPAPSPARCGALPTAPSACAGASAAAIEIPDFTRRRDEIGHLSGALRDMTNALYNRIEAIESFAADVAHELKNPLTSLRSAVETLPLAKTDESRERLLDVIQHDVRRLDRLITDISDASRLDAELQRQEARAGRSRASCSTRWSRPPTRSRRATASPCTLDFERRRPGRPSWCRATTRASARWSTTSSTTPARSRRRRHRARRPAAAARTRSRSSSTTTGRASASDAIDKIFERFYTDRPRPGLRPEFRPRPVDLQADRRGAWRHASGPRTAPAPATPSGAAEGARRALRRAPAGEVSVIPGRRRSRRARNPYSLRCFFWRRCQFELQRLWIPGPRLRRVPE